MNNRRFLNSYFEETIPRIIEILSNLHLEGKNNQSAILNKVDSLVGELHKQFISLLNKNKEYQEKDTTKVLEVEKLYLQVKGKQL